MSDAKPLAKALLVYVEPTPYVLGFVDHLTRAWPGGADVIFIGENLSQPWHLRLESPDWEVLPKSRFAAARRLLRRIRDGGYSVVHLAGWGHPLLLLAMIFSRMLRLPVAVETDTQPFPGQSWTKRAAKRILYPSMLGIPSIFLAGGSRQRRYLQNYGVPDSRIAVAHMTVDVAAIAAHVKTISPNYRREFRMGMGVSGDECAFLFVGRLEPAKGIASLLNAYSEMAARRGDVRLFVVGAGTLGELVRTAESSASGLRRLGRLDGRALLDLYAAADVFVLPSLFEPWGLVVNEAMAAGLPVIATERVGCVDYLVIDGQTGIVVEADRPALLADAMMRLADDASLRRAMGAAGRDRIAGWTIESEAQIVTEAWRRVTRA